MINYRYEVEESEKGFFWMVYIYANSDLIGRDSTCYSELEAETYGKAFIDGVKFARGQS